MFLFYTSTTNKISIERGPRGEWGPGSARARKKLQFGALDARARADPRMFLIRAKPPRLISLLGQDPFHLEDPFELVHGFCVS